MIAQSYKLKLGAPAPDFHDLPGVDGQPYSLGSFHDKPFLAVIFSCNHCPYVQAFEDRMMAVQRDYLDRGVQLVAINSNDEAAYPDDSFDHMIQRAEAKGFNFPYLRDAPQAVAEAYGAVCTPHVLVFDKERKLRYQGRIEDGRDPRESKTKDLRDALDDLLAHKSVRVPETPAFGCSIKWGRVQPRA
ncbi:MAG TPA: thioredoxin family protein [Candidatus Thermoplasmatota archaeon]|jgi:peroxiredoxin|nr:thioredoxin family protein [Candidatus Thermoplasmatota archaeon]